ncbi:Fmp30p [Sugiyamaella lignohabitans]|uniref:Fmp30p n=1 Tax=Sugiyamaella lignohabitans TaxID=796027 RepID=A0A167F556_9ASCO|nr:Fmp30p [Sugiyamaella lignohabitans]ANB14841.1 Fmp30p [Sugiyamaella lignohabitans]
MLGVKARTGIGIVVAYTAYSTYIQLRTSYEISERARVKLVESDLEEGQKADWPGTKFGSMIVAGKYVNPFQEYRTQTVFEFIYCRITELFHAKPRGGVPLDPQLISKVLPTRMPDFDLLFRNAKEYHNRSRNGREGDTVLDLNDLVRNNVNGGGNVTRSQSGEEKSHDDRPIGHCHGRIGGGDLEVDSGSDLLPDVNNRLTLTWLGQSCAFVQFPGFNMLTDPCLGEHLVSQYVGPKRISPPPCGVKDLPKVDVVLVSHDHPDHLELEVADEIGNDALWIVPVGVGSHLEKRGITNYRELDWWQKIRLPFGGETSVTNQITDQETTNGSTNGNNVVKKTSPQPVSGWEVACTPAMHWSGRKMVDSNDTLWCSFMVLNHNKPIFYHAGDTGYSPDLFTGIQKVFGGGCQVAMLPCGAYTPRWHLRPQHIDPYEAIQVMKDLGAHKMIGVHWGTFVLSDEHFLEPREKLHAIAKRENIEHSVIAPEFGRTMVFRLDNDDASHGRKKYIRDGHCLLMD